MITTSSPLLDALLGLGQLPHGNNVLEKAAATLALTTGLAGDALNAAIVGMGMVEAAHASMTAAEFAGKFGPALGNVGTGVALIGALAGIGQALAGDPNGAAEAWAGGAAAFLAGDVAAAALAAAGAGTAISLMGPIFAGAVVSILVTWLWEEVGGPGAATFTDYFPNPLAYFDPLLFDLNGDGIQTISVHESTAHFDYTGQGFSVQTGWSATDAFLVHEVDGNPMTISRADLVGAASGNALSDLINLDENGDRVLNGNDAAFSQLQLWHDANGNGVLDAGELGSGLTTTR